MKVWVWVVERINANHEFVIDSVWGVHASAIARCEEIVESEGFGGAATITECEVK